MKPAAAFRACYSDWKVIKTRKIVSIAFEVPIEHADLAYQALGGMPNPAAEVWCGIARIQEASPDLSGDPNIARADGSTTAGRPAPVEESRATKRNWADLPPQTQAAIVGAEPAFWRFAQEQHETIVRNEAHAAEFIRQFCHVESRKDLATDHRARVLWHGLQDQYRIWNDHPELVS